MRKLKKLIERRSHRRFPVDQRCWFEGEKVTLYGRITNASLSGAFIRTAARLEGGEPARLIYTDGDGGQTVIQIEVVWVSDGSNGREPGCGLRLLAYEKGEERWKALVTRSAPDKPELARDVEGKKK